ncbi:hypothetical protein [Methanocalculus sp.]|uniref:hypothetical protein n=1 Tax=Methanocalculus sp. TaxID=2004547 RepID=UPI00261FF383|nr:hypothetical protein [Methanocalculus sp.]MDG6250760.1 hypothetical protein [Methanocalculus sp.]
MLRTFRARIKDNYVEWDNDTERLIPKHSPVPVLITIVDDLISPVEDASLEDNQAYSGKRMAATLKKLSDMHVFREIDDPVTWQRHIRQDRRLPGRHDAD